MATTRKSDFVGEKYGDWEVVERAEAEEGKRRWLCRNMVDSAANPHRVVLQTELKHLSQVPTCTVDPDGIRRNDIGQAVHGPSNPVYVPRGAQAESAQIARSVIEAQKIESYCGVEMPEDDWTRDLPVEEVPADDTDVTLHEELVATEPAAAATTEALEVLREELSEALGEETPLLGRFAPEDISEADLDAQAPPQDPMRASIRATMSAMVEIRRGIERAEAAAILIGREVTELGLAYEATLESLDQALKVAITR